MSEQTNFVYVSIGIFILRLFTASYNTHGHTHSQVQNTILCLFNFTCVLCLVFSCLLHMYCIYNTEQLQTTLIRLRTHMYIHIASELTLNGPIILMFTAIYMSPYRNVLRNVRKLAIHARAHSTLLRSLVIMHAFTSIPRHLTYCMYNIHTNTHPHPVTATMEPSTTWTQRGSLRWSVSTGPLSPCSLETKSSSKWPLVATTDWSWLWRSRSYRNQRTYVSGYIYTYCVHVQHTVLCCCSEVLLCITFCVICVEMMWQWLVYVVNFKVFSKLGELFRCVCLVTE